MDARIHYLSWKETWYVFENDRIDVVYLSGVPEGTSKDEILRVVNNRKAFLLSRLHLVPPAETATHGSLAATAEQSGTVTWEELLAELPDYITSPEAQKLLGVNRQRISALLKTGQLRGKKDGRRWMIERASVEERLKALRK